MKETIEKALEEAEENGADLQELKRLKAMLMTGMPKATKKYLTTEERKAKQKAQKMARRKQRRK